MIIVHTMQEVNNIPVKSVIPYVRSLITNILNAYSSNGSIETVGAVYFLEGEMVSPTYAPQSMKVSPGSEALNTGWIK